MSKRQLTKWFLGPLFFLLLLVTPPLPFIEVAAKEVGAVSLKAPQIALGVLIWIATWWVFELIPLGLTGLLAATLISLLGYISWSEALRSFADPIIWVFMSGFTLAKAFRVWGLDKRVALRVARIYKGEKPMLAALFIACLPVFLLTVTGSITASTSVVYPIVLSYIEMLKLSPSFAEATMLSLGEAATAGAMLFLISTPPNLVAKQVLEQYTPNFKLTFFDWLLIGTPQAVIGLIVSWIIVFKVVKVEEKRVSKASEVIEREVSVLDKMGIEEKMVLLVFLVTLFLWLIPGILSIAASLEPSLSQMATSASRLLPEAAPAALAIVLLGLLRSRKRPLLTFEEIASGIDWNVIFLFGGGIAMGKALDTSGFSKWLALIVINTGIELNPFSLSVIGALVGFAVTFPASNTASAMVSVPLVASIAKGAGLNPTSPIIVTALACSISSAIPSTTPPMAIIYGSKKVDVKNMFKAGIISDVLRLAILALTEPYLVNLLLRLKGLS